jgi:phosphomannomutase
MNKIFLFDIDGTITNSRQTIDKTFKEFFDDFCLLNTVCFVTGSDKQKTIEQIGSDTFNLALYSFNCAGNEIWQQNKLLYKSDWTPPRELLLLLSKLIEVSSFQYKTGKHIEERTGMLNVSIPGRNCTLEERNQYINWDKETREREKILNTLKSEFPNVFDIFIGGDTGLDIFPVGKGKVQAFNYLKNLYPDSIFYYFGDQIKPGYNDYDIAIKCNHNYKVKNWHDTYEILSYFEEHGVCE